MNKILIALLLSLTLLVAFVSAAQAGFQGVYPVVLGTNVFQGSFGSARNSADNVQYLYCWDFGASGQCGARDVQGQFRSCSTNDPVHISTIRGMDDTSYIRVYFDTSGVCTRIQSLTYSATEPKLP